MKIGNVTSELETFGGIETFIKVYNKEFEDLGHLASLIPLYPYKDPEVDVLLVHFGRPTGALYGSFLSKAFNIPYIALLHGHTNYVKELVKQLEPKYLISLSDETYKNFPNSTLIRKGIDTNFFIPMNVKKEYEYIYPHRNVKYKKPEKLENYNNVLRIENISYEDMPGIYNLAYELLSFEDVEPITYTVLEAAACGLKTKLNRWDVVNNYNIKQQCPKLLEYINDIAFNK